MSAPSGNSHDLEWSCLCIIQNNSIHLITYRNNDSELWNDVGSICLVNPLIKAEDPRWLYTGAWQYFIYKNINFKRNVNGYKLIPTEAKVVPSHNCVCKMANLFQISKTDLQTNWIHMV